MKVLEAVKDPLMLFNTLAGRYKGWRRERLLHLLMQVGWERSGHLDTVQLVAQLPVRLLAGPAAVPLHLAARALHQLRLLLGRMA